MNASLERSYTNCKTTAADSPAVNAGEIKVRPSMTDARIVNGPSLAGLTFAVKKPGFYRYVPKKLRNTFRLAKKPFELSYGRKRGDKRTVYDGAVVFDSGSKVSASYVLGTRNCKLKYSYLHGGVTTLEPCYDLGRNAWDFAISRRLYDNVFKATYQIWSKNLALEWLRNRVFNGTFKISASVNLAEKSKDPKFIAETTWELET
ncbi:outer envelope pore protein 24B, chloroplastic-like [Hibiscus syriacus]|uniref:outer envelope pore protein 24B, chloroplastic-like n=1 Tax=Hibiscus syriacus TaxID=106335 RepID=UPI00192453CE|nr:outer envelope pore protein 24B, chloroplastic-like [Hibiscus syriacus]